jgi:hypothetical protein
MTIPFNYYQNNILNYGTSSMLAIRAALFVPVGKIE